MINNNGDTDGNKWAILSVIVFFVGLALVEPIAAVIDGLVM